MAPANKQFQSKTQHYLKVKKPLVERQRRARINKCLDVLKTLVAELQDDDSILRMDKAEMLESVRDFVRRPPPSSGLSTPTHSFCHGYMNAVGEVSRRMAATPGMDVGLGKVVMTQLGFEFNRMLQTSHNGGAAAKAASDRAASPASSGYHSDCSQSPATSPVEQTSTGFHSVWRPW